MSKDGTISIDIEVDGKQINVASKELDKLEESGHKSGKGIKSAEDSMDSLSDKSSKAGSSVKGASDAIDDLGASGSKAGKGLKGTDGAIDDLADSSAKAGSNVKGASDAIDDLGSSGSKAGKDLKGADSAIDGISDSSASASSNVKGTAESLDSLADSGSKAGKDLKGADSAIDGLSDSSAEAAKGVKGASDSLGGMSESAEEAAAAAKKAKEEAEGLGQESESASGKTKKFAVSLGLIAVAASAFAVLKSSMDDAITRFDTLATFPKVLQELGVSAEESERAMSNLSNGIDGLPTTLNDIAANAQKMYTSFNDMDMATDAAIALNNALLGSGSSAAEAQRGTDQYIKALQTGKMDMMMWNTLSETMDVGLIKIAEGFGYAGKSAKNDLYEALQSGSVTMDDFTNKLIEVGTGTGIMAQLAKENSLGIATSLGNLKNAAARGIADIIDSFNKLSQSVTGKDIAQNIDGLKAVVNASFKAIGSVIEGTTPVVIFFADGVKATLPVVNALTPAIIGLMAAYATYTVISKATDIIKASNAVLIAAQASQSALTLAVTANTVAQAKQTGTITAGNLIIGVLTGRITLATAATIAKTAATYAWGAALRFLAGPVGWVVAGIGLLVAGVIAVVKWFNKTSEEADRLNAETEKLGESVDSLTGSVGSNAEAYKEQQTSIEATAKANGDLAQKIDELSEKENKSAAEKQMLASYVDQLNESVEGLNLSYSAEADALSMSSEELQGRVDLMEQQTSYNEALERQVEIAKEQHEVDMKLAEINELREEWLEKMENGEIKSKEYAAALAELVEQEDGLKEANVELAEQYQLTEEQMVTSMDAITEATQNGITNQIIAFEDLSESQQATVESMKATWEDYKSAATDMFDTLNEKAEITAGEMASNLEENQRIISEWATNIATLAERGIDEGLLNTLREAGPESAGHVNALVNASDEELQRLSSAFADGGDVATDALSKSLGIEESGVMEAVGHLVTETEASLKQQLEAADFESIGSAIPEGLEGGIKDGSPKAENASKQMAEDTTKAAKAALDVNSPSGVFKEIGTNITEGLVLGINNGASKVIEAINKMFKSVQTDSKQSFDGIVKDHEAAVKEIETTLNKLSEVTQKAMKDMLDRLKSGAPPQVQVMLKLAKDLLNPFKNTPKQFEDIGKESMAGFNRGLKAGEAQVMKTARGIANSAANEMRKALDIHSPSRVTTKIGEETGQGVVDGLDNKQKDVSATSKKMAETVASIIKGMNEDVKGETLKHNAEIKTIEKRSKQDIDLIHIKAAEGKRKLTQAETVRIERITEDANKKIVAIEEKAAKEREKIAKDGSKSLIEISENYVKQKKANGEMSLKDEGHFWNEMKRAATVGSDEYERALSSHQNVVKEMRSAIESVNEHSAKRILEIDKKLVADTQKLNGEWDQAYTKKFDSLMNMAGLLEEYVEKEDVSGQKLIQNMQSQVIALGDYADVIGSLGNRIDNDSLFEELQALGTKSLAELKALNSMSDSELRNFEDLYEKRFELARTQANKELEPLKDDITQQIKDLNEASQEELEVVHKEWTAAIENIVLGTRKEFDSMNQVGKDAVKGLEDGMLSMESSLMSTARRIANSIKATMQSALDINSPSMVMRNDVGRWIPEGIALGIKDNAKSVYRELDNLSSGMILSSTPEQALGTSRMAYNGWSGTENSNSTTSNDNRKTFSPKIENHFTPEESTPSESARKQEQLLQRLAMEF